MIFLYDNKVDDFTVTALSCETGFAAINVQDQQLTKAWRSTGTSSEWIMVDLGTTTVPIDHVALAGHNFSTGATITFQMSSESNFASTALSTGLTYRAGIIMEAVTATTKRYARWKIDDTSNGDGYIKIGRGAMGTKLEIASYAEPAIQTKMLDSSIVKHSLTGQFFADVGIVTDTIENVAFPITTQAVKDSLETMFNDVKTAEPIFLQIYKDKSTDFKPFYGTFAEGLSFEHLENLTWVMEPISFVEAK